MEGILGAADVTLQRKHEKLKKRVETLEETVAWLERLVMDGRRETGPAQSSEPKRDLGPDLIQLKRNFEARTRKHIALVQRNLGFLAQANEDVAGQLADRGEVHDASKFSEEERWGYMLLTEAHRTGNFDFSAETRLIIDEAVRIHKRRNRHHPEFHRNNTDQRPMSQTDMYEMVADWAAIAQEKTSDEFASPREYFETVAVTKYGFSANDVKRIERIIRELETILKKQPHNRGGEEERM